MSGQLLSRVAPDILYDIVPDALFTWGKELSTVSLKNSNIVLNHEMENYMVSMIFLCHIFVFLVLHLYQHWIELKL